jgi:Xaa-Pro aminopeptidase
MRSMSARPALSGPPKWSVKSWYAARDTAVPCASAPMPDRRRHKRNRLCLSSQHHLHDTPTPTRRDPLLELGLVADNYWADRTRVRIAGKASEAQQACFAAVIQAQEAAVAAIKPGIAASVIDDVRPLHNKSAGYGSFFPHITGHGLGFGYHESSPILGPQSQDVLEVGMLTSVEPAIYDKSFGGMRIEDDVLVTSTGARVLGSYLKSLI